MHRLSLALFLLCLVGCPPGLLVDLQAVPVCDEQGGTDAQCAGPGSSSGESPDLTTSGGDDDEGVMTTDLLTGGSMGGTSEPAIAPSIVSVRIDPEVSDEAAPITVQVEAIHSASVTMALDGGEPVSLAASGANFYQGAIEVHGASMNGAHTVVITAANAGLLDVQPADFEVHAPEPGNLMWLRANEVFKTSQTRAITVDRASNVYEVGTSGTGAAARLVVSKRDEFGEPVWPGATLTYHQGESRGEDVAVGPDGMIYVLANYVDETNHTRWWLGKLDPETGLLMDEPWLGEVDEPAHGLSVADNGDIAIVGDTTVWSALQQMNDTQTVVWFRPVNGAWIIKQWGYTLDLTNSFADIPEDVLITDKRIFVTGSAEGRYHLGAPDDKVPRKRAFVFEMNFKGEIVREYVAANTPYARSGGSALAIDGHGGVTSAGWACDDICTQVGEILWFRGDGPLEPYARHTEEGVDGPAYALDIAYSPAGYNAVASAVSMGAGLNLAMRVTGRRPEDLALVFDYVFDTPVLEMGQAVAVGPHGYIWFGGLRVMDDAIRAVVGRSHG